MLMLTAAGGVRMVNALAVLGLSTEELAQEETATGSHTASSGHGAVGTVFWSLQVSH
jgi:hypothetical protein